MCGIWVVLIWDIYFTNFNKIVKEENWDIHIKKITSKSLKAMDAI